MKHPIVNWILKKFGQWLLKNDPARRAYLSDFHRVAEELRMGDVLLVEGRSRASNIIKHVTSSPWSHAALYIGNLDDVQDEKTKEHIQKKWHKETKTTQLLIESELGLGTVISPLTKYRQDHVRILRPHGLSHADAQRLVDYTVTRLGKRYNLRHLLDLARFLFPWGLFPRRWRSSLFQHNALKPTEDICSSMIAEAFSYIQFPILPVVMEDDHKNIELIQRNPRLFTPSDFDYSPYFDVIKYPIFKLGKHLSPDQLPWKKGYISDDTDIRIYNQKEGRQ